MPDENDAGDVSTRVLRIEDYDAVVQLWEQAEGVHVGTGDDRETIARYLERNPGLSRVAERTGNGGRIVGAVLCGHDGRRGLIYHLAVAREERGRGIGRRLVSEGLAGLRAAGIERVLILVLGENQRGRDFWVEQGFEEMTWVKALAKDLR